MVLYQNGATQQEIAKKYLQQELRKSRKVTISAVGYALKKSRGIHAQTLEDEIRGLRPLYNHPPPPTLRLLRE